MCSETIDNTDVGVILITTINVILSEAYDKENTSM